MSRGKFVVIEGLDGSGKATQTNLICEKLKEKNKNFCKLSFPNYKDQSSALVKMYLNSELGNSFDDVNAYAASSFYAVDRYASYKKYWQEDYENGKFIIADRYTTSNEIYQLCRLEEKFWDEYIDWIEDYEYNKLGLPKPNLVIYLDMPVEVSQNLMKARYQGDDSKKDLYEKNVEFLEKCRKTARYTAKKLNWKIVDCCQDKKLMSIYKINKLIENIIYPLI